MRQARYERTESFFDNKIDIRALKKFYVVAALPMIRRQLHQTKRRIFIAVVRLVLSD